ncbi:MAG TPA: hypothetical protein VHD83_11250, partial [Puia sp.]|nr:hypothetical protein [Puia sp.]
MARRRSRQVHQYDKIFKENIEEALPGLIKNLFGIHAIHTEELPDDIQHTRERIPDVLKRLTVPSGKKFILHIEFQTQNEPEMAFRMAEYFIMLLRKYQLPVRQYVIYVGRNRPLMTDHISTEQMSYKYHLITLSSIDYHLFLQRPRPEEKMLAILANFGNDDPASAIKGIVKQVIDASSGDFAAQRHINQLRILAQLPKFDQEILTMLDNLESVFSDEQDILYRIGEMKGERKGEAKATKKAQEKFVKRLLRKTDFTIAEIAGLVEVSQYFVRKIKKSMA